MSLLQEKTGITGCFYKFLRNSFSLKWPKDLFKCMKYITVAFLLTVTVQTLILWSRCLSALVPSFYLVEMLVARSCINFSSFQTLPHLWRQTAIYYKIKCTRLHKWEHSEMWQQHRNGINRISNLQRHSKRKSRKSFKTVPRTPTSAVTGHMSAFAKRSVCPA